MAPVVRFAPSPTGLLHIGNARTALLNALFARREGGAFLLRFDDTDLERSRPEFAAAIEADLAWLGIPPDIVVRQSDRFALYADAAERLKAMGRLYAAYETPDELEFRRKRQLARGPPPAGPRRRACPAAAPGPPAACRRSTTAPRCGSRPRRRRRSRLRGGPRIG